MSDFFQSLGVSRETIQTLEKYQSLLLEWQKKINLVSRETIDDFWQRHIVDSGQLVQYMPNKKSRILDLGSGAGLPAVVLSIMGFSDVTLVESNSKKIAFLKEVRRNLGLNYTIAEERIETIPPFTVDVITSRALASLEKLLVYAEPFVTKSSQLIFHKGQKSQEEILKASKNWSFEVSLKQSITSREGAILILSGLCKKNESNRNC
tara:strand:+ start:1469 stop:2089 length:621 start_codon:yes stop_codon:yes gene_type:complete